MNEGLHEKSEMKNTKKVDFSPRGRRLEYELNEKCKQDIDKLEISEEKKEEMRFYLKEYILAYEEEYQRYYQSFKDYMLPHPGLN